jgi:hypothetical protein
VGDWLQAYGAATLAWILVAGRLIGPYRFDTPERRSITIIMVGVAGTTTLTSQLGYGRIGSLLGVPNIARPLGHACMLMVVWAALNLLLALGRGTAPRRPRWPGWWLLATLAGMIVTFLLADTPVDDVRFAGRYGAKPWVLEYWLVFISYVVPALIVIGVLGCRYAKATGRRSLRFGLYLLSAGSTMSALYHVHKALYFTALRFGLKYPSSVRDLLDVFLPLVSTILVVVGLILPTWSPHVRAWLRDYRTYQRLRPLWRALYTANPAIALMAPKSWPADLIAVRDLSLRLYRRVIEIRDGRLALAPYFDPAVAVTARADADEAGFTGQRAEAFVEAMLLTSALDAHRSGTTTASAQATEIPGGTDLRADTVFLEEVARAFHRLGKHADWPTPAPPVPNRYSTAAESGRLAAAPRPSGSRSSSR